MAKWLFTLMLTVVIAGLFMPRVARLLRRIGMPGDLAFRFRGETYHFPFGSALIFSLLALAVARWF
jgi:hypothetical protein